MKEYCPDLPLCLVARDAMLCSRCKFMTSALAVSFRCHSKPLVKSLSWFHYKAWDVLSLTFLGITKQSSMELSYFHVTFHALACTGMSLTDLHLFLKRTPQLQALRQPL